MPGNDIMDQPPLFIVGSPRSGTTVLAATLSSHPELHVANEMRVLKYLDKSLDALSELMGFRQDLNDAVLKSLCAAQLGDLMDGLILRPLNKSMWGDKFPGYARSMQDLEAYFPTCRFIHIIRDGRDVACSMLNLKAENPEWNQADWAPSTYFGAAKKWCDFVSRARDYSANLNQDRFLEIRYEALMTTPSIVMAEVWRFLNMSPLNDSAYEHLGGRSIGSFREKMSPEDLDEWSRFGPAISLLNELGYQDKAANRIATPSFLGCA